ncbi:DsrE family protein [Candidatus Parabeggiatoa sp. HSG14]|uniref:DsrE family protein n=1 Tax=Candidatus Parabeggiatoa sp. HSG14 TaxID=3055593 RepID=UPI0025A6CA05|nr:DsrE family protein [Thiotrichales bacterium HSG14]
MKLLKHVFFIILLSLSVATFSLTQAEEVDKPQIIVVHLSNFTGDLHAALMAIKFANTLQAKGAQVTLFLDMEAVRAADYRQPQNLKWGMVGSSFAEQYNVFVKTDGQVILCPHCAMAAGITEKYLRNGAKMGTVESITDLLFAADKVIDY